jgi:hypothetical protein
LNGGPALAHPSRPSADRQPRIWIGDEAEAGKRGVLSDDSVDRT